MSIPIDPVTGLPVDPAIMAGAMPTPMVGPDGLPLDPMMMAGMQAGGPAVGPAGPPAPPEMMAPPTPPMPEPPMDPVDGIIAILMDGSAEDIEELLSNLEAPEKALLRELVVNEIELTDPLRAKYLLTFLPEKREGGQLPPWMDAEPQKPSAERVNELAMLDAEAWAPVVEKDKDTLEYLIPPYKSHVFKTFNEKKDERYHSPMLLNEVNLIVNKGSASSYTYEMPYSDPAHADATQQCEDFLYESDRQATRLWGEAYDGDMERDAWYTLVVKDRLITLVLPCFDSTERFTTERLMDPSNTFPYWEGERGLGRVTRMYQATAGEVVGDFDPYGDLGLRERIIGQRIKDSEQLYEHTTRGKVTQYWDRWWYVVLFDDIEVVAEKHKFGFTPFVVTGGNAGLPRYFTEINGRPEVAGNRIHDNLLSAKYPSAIEHMKEFAGLREKIGTVFLTMLSKAHNPPMLVYQDSVAMAQGTPNIDTDMGKISPVALDREKVEPLPTEAAPPAVFTPFYNMFGQDAAMTFMPEAAHGVSASQQSGNALENLFEVGNDKLTGWYKAMARHKAGVASMRLKLWRDWGHKWKDGRERYGRMRVPYARQRRATMPKDAPPAFDFLPEVVEMVGTTVEVDYTSVRLQNLTQLGNAVMIWKQANAMSAREAMEIRGVRDPDAITDEIIFEQAMNDPAIMQARIRRALRHRDPELLAELEAGAMMGGGSGGQPGNTGSSSEQPVPNSSTLNLTGMGKGAQGPTGRPTTGGFGTPPV